MNARWCHVAWLVALVGVLEAVAEEPAERFLAALREKRYYDVAILYLDRLEAHPATPDEFRREIPLQRGITLTRAAAVERDRAARERYLQGAKENLERFLREQPEHPKKSVSQWQFGELLREWGRMKAEQAAQTQDAQTRQDAAALFDQAYGVFDTAVTQLRDELAGLRQTPEGADDPEARERREALRTQYLDALLSRAETRELRAEAELPDSAERPKFLVAALELYTEMVQKYPDRQAGVQARLNAARVRIKQGDLDKALQLVDDILRREDASKPAARALMAQGFLLALECWMHESKREYATAVERTQPWVDQMHPGEETEPVWVSLQLQLAKAHVALADQLQASDSGNSQIKTSRDEARRLARAVTRVPGPRQAEARALLATIPGGVRGAQTVQKPPAVTFAEAQTNAEEALAEMRNADELVRALAERLPQETAARENLLAAVRLADAKTPSDDLNYVRRLLAYLHYLQQDYYEAAVLGEFVGRRFPTAAGAETSAQIALAAYLKLYEASEPEQRDFATQHIVSLANYIVETWAGSPAAADAINTLIPLLVSRGEVDKARQYAENMPETSPQRAAAELRIGESLWRDYLLGMNEVRAWERELQAGEEPANELRDRIARRKVELDGLKQSALAILEAGVERSRQTGAVHESMPRAVLALAQIYVDLDQATRALTLLDDEKIGVLPLLARQDPALDQPLLREQAYRVALSAVVSALPHATEATDRSALIERSRQLMDALRKEVGDAPGASQRLIEVLYGLARGLETQITLLERPEDRQVLSEGLSAFLDQVRGESTDLRILNWVAESFASLGRGLGDDPRSAEARRACFAHAIETYRQILDRPGTEPLASEMRRGLQLRLALAQRSGGQFSDAIATFRQMLAEDGRKVDVQVEAALTYQLWAAEPQQAPKYKLAVGGGEPDPATQKNLIWGWNRIAQTVSRYEAYRDVYHQARFNAAQCHYKYALRLRAPADRQKYLQSAKDYIVFTQRLYPQMGGAPWRGKYDALLKTIQRALNEPVVGLGVKPSAGS